MLFRMLQAGHSSRICKMPIDVYAANLLSQLHHRGSVLSGRRPQGEMVSLDTSCDLMLCSCAAKPTDNGPLCRADLLVDLVATPNGGVVIRTEQALVGPGV